MSDDLQIEPRARSELFERKERPRLIDVREPWEHNICRLDGAELGRRHRPLGAGD